MRMMAYPEWLHILAWVYIGICAGCALVLLIHTLSRPQKMWIMGVVWPVTALYMGPFAVYMYLKSLPVLERKPMSPQMKAIEERVKDRPPTNISEEHCGLPLWGRMQHR